MDYYELISIMNFVLLFILWLEKTNRSPASFSVIHTKCVVWIRKSKILVNDHMNLDFVINEEKMAKMIRYMNLQNSFIHFSIYKNLQLSRRELAETSRNHRPWSHRAT